MSVKMEIRIMNKQACCADCAENPNGCTYCGRYAVDIVRPMAPMPLYPFTWEPVPCTTEGEHCNLCGSEQEATRSNEGYSSCCNEPIVDGPEWCEGHAPN